MQVSLNSIHCPLCRGTDHKPIVSTYKFDSGAGDDRQHPLIKAVLCTNCGLVFENPCVDMQRSADHADGHCYPSQDILARQSRHQGHVNELRWQLLEHRIAMERCRRVYPEVTAVCETFERFEECVELRFHQLLVFALLHERRAGGPGEGATTAARCRAVSPRSVLNRLPATTKAATM